MHRCSTSCKAPPPLGYTSGARLSGSNWRRYSFSPWNLRNSKDATKANGQAVVQHNLVHLEQHIAPRPQEGGVREPPAHVGLDEELRAEAAVAAEGADGREELQLATGPPLERADLARLHHLRVRVQQRLDALHQQGQRAEVRGHHRHGGLHGAEVLDGAVDNDAVEDLRVGHVGAHAVQAVHPRHSEAHVLHDALDLAAAGLDLVAVAKGPIEVDEHTRDEVAHEVLRRQAHRQAADAAHREHRLRAEAQEVGPGQDHEAEDDGKVQDALRQCHALDQVAHALVLRVLPSVDKAGKARHPPGILVVVLQPTQSLGLWDRGLWGLLEMQQGVAQQ
mmetsp:Transcript_112918/g.299994  ORF Transcript_112918/g.299994 Transcript_112918/m.299994 type:complete len:335 (+) Transcript_112918:26-1030(+)